MVPSVDSLLALEAIDTGVLRRFYSDTDSCMTLKLAGLSVATITEQLKNNFPHHDSAVGAKISGCARVGEHSNTAPPLCDVSNIIGILYLMSKFSGVEHEVIAICHSEAQQACLEYMKSSMRNHSKAHVADQGPCQARQPG